MDGPAELSVIARWLADLAGDSERRRAVVVVAPGDGGAIEARIAPDCVLESEDSFWAALTGPIRERMRGNDAVAVGLLLPAELDGGAISPVSWARAEGVALVGAQRVPSGAVSFAYYAAVADGELAWREAHDEAQWIATPLRGFVAESPLELGESNPAAWT